jgi:AAA domain/PD-(D/E)XK nuclease superfamily
MLDLSSVARLDQSVISVISEINGNDRNLQGQHEAEVVRGRLRSNGSDVILGSMSRFFNNAGPQILDDHYTLDPLRRVKVDELLRLIEAKRYFVLHAPRQSGKTSSLLALRDKLNAEGKYRALYINIEAVKAMEVHKVQESMAGEMAQLICETFPEVDGWAMLNKARLSLPDEPFRHIISQLSALDRLRPLVLFIDEADTLQGHAMVTFLSQLRAGYTRRPHGFPQSIILCGLRDIRDFRITDKEGNFLSTGSAFNILADSLTLGNFSQAEIEELYAQHTAETGQVFSQEALDLVWELTRGQPWMVNKLADFACFMMAPGTDRSVEITAELIMAAREEMIQRRTVHLDNLAFRLKDERVRKVIGPMLQSDSESVTGIDSDDVRYCLDLGLIRRDADRVLRIANPIYREIIPRELTAITQELLEESSVWYRQTDGRMDIPKLLAAFQTFYRANSEADRRFPQYHEAGAQLLLQAWLQRIINGGGQIEREYGLGMGRVDLLVRWPYPRPVQEIVIELKVVRPKDSAAQVLSQGLAQIERYMDQVSATEGHLLIFDQRPGLDWETKITQSPATTPGGKAITVWGA